jgi:hypothetical protein
MRMRRVLVIGCAAVALLGACGDDDDSDDASDEATTAGDEGTDDASGDEAVTLSAADFSGAAEVPGPGDTDATGTVERLEITDGQLCVTFAVANLDDPATAAHVHRGTSDVAGDVVVNLGPPADAAGGSWDACVAIDDAAASEIEADPTGFYLNVHTAAFPDGAARAQLTG